jgi:hypothetical protein
LITCSSASMRASLITLLQVFSVSFWSLLREGRPWMM